ADVDVLLYLPGRRREDLTRAVSITAPSDGWRQSFSDLLESATATDTADTSSWTGFRRGRVVALTAETADVRSVTLQSEDRQPLPTFKSGQYLTLRVPSVTAGAVGI